MLGNPIFISNFTISNINLIFKTMIQFVIEALIFLLAIYYVTVFVHFWGWYPIFKKLEINPFLALIPFYYWFKRDLTV